MSADESPESVWDRTLRVLKARFSDSLEQVLGELSDDEAEGVCRTLRAMAALLDDPSLDDEAEPKIKINLRDFFEAFDRQVVPGGGGQLRPWRKAAMRTAEDHMVRALFGPDRMIGRRAARRTQERNALLLEALGDRPSGRRGSAASRARRCEGWLARHKPEAYERLFPRRVSRKTGEPLPRVTRDAVRVATGEKKPRR